MAEKKPYEELLKKIRNLERDASELKRIVAKAVRMAKEWKTTFDATNDVIWILDEKQRILRCNQTSERTFGHSTEKIMGRFCWEIIHETNKPIPECPVQSAKHSLKRASMELQIARNWFLITADPILDKNGHYKGSVHIARDITKRKQLEKKLTESRQKYHNLFENGSDLLCIHDLEGNLLETNLSYKKQYGLEEKNLEGINIRDFIPDEYKVEFDQYLERIIKNGVDKGFLRGINNFGHEVILEYNNTLMYDDEGRPTAIQGSARDVTDRVIAEKALKQSEEKFKNIFNNAIDGIVLVDIQTKKIFTCNPAFCSMFGYHLQEITHIGIEDIHPQEYLLIAQDGFKSQAKGEKALVENIPCLRRDGTIFYADINSASMEMEGKKYNIGFFRDITDRKHAEDDRDKVILELKESLDKIKQLSGLLPICSYCKKIRDDKGYWNQLEAYIQNHSEAEFSHGICQECAKKYFPDIYKKLYNA